MLTFDGPRYVIGEAAGGTCVVVDQAERRVEYDFPDRATAEQALAEMLAGTYLWPAALAPNGGLDDGAL